MVPTWVTLADWMAVPPVGTTGGTGTGGAATAMPVASTRAAAAERAINGRRILHSSPFRPVLLLIPASASSCPAFGMHAAARVDRPGATGMPFLKPSSAVDHALHSFGVALADDLDLGGRLVELGDVLGTEREICSCGVPLEPLDPPRPRNGSDPRLLRQQPGEGDLTGCGALAVGYAAHQVDKGLVGLSRFHGEPREPGADVAFGELGRGAHRAGEEPTSERAERHEADPELLQCRQDLGLGLGPEQGVLRLQRRHGLH